MGIDFTRHEGLRHYTVDIRKPDGESRQEQAYDNFTDSCRYASKLHDGTQLPIFYGEPPDDFTGHEAIIIEEKFD